MRASVPDKAARGCRSTGGVAPGPGRIRAASCRRREEREAGAPGTSSASRSIGRTRNAASTCARACGRRGHESPGRDQRRSASSGGWPSAAIAAFMRANSVLIGAAAAASSVGRGEASRSGHRRCPPRSRSARHRARTTVVARIFGLRTTGTRGATTFEAQPARRERAPHALRSPGSRSRTSCIGRQRRTPVLAGSHPCSRPSRDRVAPECRARARRSSRAPSRDSATREIFAGVALLGGSVADSPTPVRARRSARATDAGVVDVERS